MSKTGRQVRGFTRSRILSITIIGIAVTGVMSVVFRHLAAQRGSDGAAAVQLIAKPTSTKSCSALLRCRH
jgi:hypothetical protein